MAKYANPARTRLCAKWGLTPCGLFDFAPCDRLAAMVRDEGFFKTTAERHRSVAELVDRCHAAADAAEPAFAGVLPTVRPWAWFVFRHLLAARLTWPADPGPDAAAKLAALGREALTRSTTTVAPPDRW
jgi:hypothetical protein